jgi:hypothetical protein
MSADVIVSSVCLGEVVVTLSSPDVGCGSDVVVVGLSLDVLVVTEVAGGGGDVEVVVSRVGRPTSVPPT